MEDLKKLSALTALNNMMQGGHFNICVIDRVAELLDIRCKDSEAYRVLHPLHCIDWNKMPKELRDAVPELIQQCLGVSPVFQFTTLEPQVIDIEPARKRGGFLRLLGGLGD